MIYSKILKEFRENPRDVHTVPMNKRKPMWFYVFVKDGCVFIEQAHCTSPACKVKKRKLNENECEEMSRIYHKRQNGECVSKEAQCRTFSQVYWYGIFNEIGV